MKKKFTFVSFFSGIEGFRLGLEAAGWNCIYSVEIEPFCGDVQRARYGHGPAAPDINKLKAKDIPDADLWVAGWPCQGLSVAGLRKGLADDRSGLFWQFVRLLERKRPRRLLAENVPGLLTTCSCSRCGFQCKDCGAPAGADDEACQVCDSERLGGRVVPEHRGTDLFVVLTALQRVGYGVQTRILDAQHFGVPQRRRRIFFVGHLGTPCASEILFEPEGRYGHLAARREARQDAAGELARSIGGVGGGNDYGAGKGTLVKRKTVAHSVTAYAGHHGHSSPRGDGTDNLVAATLGTNHKPDRGQKGENIVASILQSPAGGHRTTDTSNLIGPIAATEKAHTISKGTGGGLGGRDGQDDYVLLRVDQTRSDPIIRNDKITDSIATGTGHGGYANQAIARHEVPEVFEPRFVRNGRGAPSPIAPALKAQNGSSGKGDGAPCVVGPAVAATLTAGSNPNSNIAGRRREDDENIVVTGPRREAVPKRVAPTATHHFERTGGETECSRLIQQPLFIHTADGGANQNQVKTDGKTDCLSKAQPGVVAFDPQGGGKQSNLGSSEKRSGALGCTKTPAIAYNVKGMAHGGDKHAYETETAGTVDRDGSRPSGNEAGTLIGPTPMSIRRLTASEWERLMGLPCGWTCLCGVRPDCPDRRIPPWVDPSTFALQGCGHSACGCSCPDSPRYKSLGNSVAVPVVRWIGERILRALLPHRETIAAVGRKR